MLPAHDRVLLGHGSGGLLSHRLIADHMVSAWENPLLTQLGDAAVCDVGGARVAFTTDSYVVTPLFFPGGNIGRLAVCGTVNDLAMSGAKPLYLSCGFIIEEGLEMTTLDRIIAEMHIAAEEAGVQIVTGDTKVVAGGHADQIFINTAGIGLVDESVRLSPNNIKVGDAILINGTVGDHGVAVLSEREGLKFETTVNSDAAPLNHLTAALLDAGINIRVLRDATRGGVATVLNELAETSGCCLRLDESAVPIRKEVASACEMLGLNPLHVANEGKCIMVIDGNDSERALDILRSQQYGEEAEVIGEVMDAPAGKVIAKTAIGGERIVDMLTGEQLPRIC
jgi:hydrogenase expression/formation protein HypE